MSRNPKAWCCRLCIYSRGSQFTTQPARPFFLFISFPALEACLKGMSKGAATPEDEALPTASTLALQLFACMLIDDTLFYW